MPTSLIPNGCQETLNIRPNETKVVIKLVFSRRVSYWCGYDSEDSQIFVPKNPNSIDKKNSRVPVNKELLTGTRPLAIKNYWQGAVPFNKKSFQGQYLLITNPYGNLWPIKHALQYEFI